MRVEFAGGTRRKTESNGVRSVSLPVSSLICPRSVSGEGLKVISPRPTTTNAVVPPPTVAANAEPRGIERSRSSAVMWRLVTLNCRVGSRESRNSPSTDDTVDKRVTFGSLSAGPSRSISQVASRAVMPAWTSASTRTRSPVAVVARSRSSIVTLDVAVVTQRFSNTSRLPVSAFGAARATREPGVPASMARCIRSMTAPIRSGGLGVGCAAEAFPSAASDNASTARRQTTHLTGADARHDRPSECPLEPR